MLPRRKCLPLPLAGRAIAYEEKRGVQLACGHPSRRPPTAGPQDEVAFCGEILDPHGEEPAKAGVSNHAGRAHPATSNCHMRLPSPASGRGERAHGSIQRQRRLYAGGGQRLLRLRSDQKKGRDRLELPGAGVTIRPVRGMIRTRRAALAQRVKRFSGKIMPT